MRALISLFPPPE
uniref:Uncharacterized protein n=1 Tax=Anguilla anguilla TaxID=7936 RepID=A0A0E9Y1K4_ANGAN